MKPGMKLPELFTPDNATYISELNPDLPSINDPISEGAGQIQTTKRATQNSFPNIGGAVTATHQQLNTVVNTTQGMIFGFTSMWTLPVDEIPAGWALCDGTVYDDVLINVDEDGIPTLGQRTMPNMSGMFVRGVVEEDITEPDEPVWEPGDTGGEDFPEFNVDGHALIEAELPSKEEMKTQLQSFRDNGENTGGEYYLSPDWQDQDDSERQGDPQELYPLIGEDEEHIHSVNRPWTEDDDIDEEDWEPSFDNRPAFFTVAYIGYVGLDAVEA